MRIGVQNTFWNEGLNGQTDQNEKNSWDESNEKNKSRVFGGRTRKK